MDQNLFVLNHAELAESFPVAWQTAIGSNVSLQAFGIATAIFVARWLLDQCHTAQHGSACAVGDVSGVIPL